MARNKAGRRRRNSFDLTTTDRLQLKVPKGLRQAQTFRPSLHVRLQIRKYRQSASLLIKSIPFARLTRKGTQRSKIFPTQNQRLMILRESFQDYEAYQDQDLDIDDLKHYVEEKIEIIREHSNLARRISGNRY